MFVLGINISHHPSVCLLDDGEIVYYLEDDRLNRVKEEDCHIIACGPKGTSAVAYGEIFETDHPNHIGFQLNDKLAPGAYLSLIHI